MVWAAIGYLAVNGPFFFEENMNGDSYLGMLQQKFMPKLNLLENLQISFLYKIVYPLTG